MKKLAIQLVHKKTLERWQQRWNVTEKGVITRKFFPNIAERLKMNWIKINHYTSQFLMGHGDFGAKLMELGIGEESKCTCGEEETNLHILLTCTDWAQKRQKLEEYFLEV